MSSDATTPPPPPEQTEEGSVATGIAIAVSGGLAFIGGLVVTLMEWPPWSWLIELQLMLIDGYYPKYTAIFTMLVLFVPIGLVVQAVRFGIGAVLRPKE